MTWFKIDSNSINFHVDKISSTTIENAIQYTVESIIEDYPSPYYIMCSGGIDSQAMLDSWVKFGKNYIPVTVQYNNDMNHHDIENIFNFTKQYNIDLIVKNFDVLKFLTTSYAENSRRFECSSPQICTYIEMTKDLEGTVVFSGNMLSPNGVYLTRALLGLEKYSKTRPCVPYFFLHTPDIAYANSFIPFDRKDLKLDGYQLKCLAYRRMKFPILPQEKPFSGFEIIKEFYDKNYFNQLDFKNRLLYSNKPSKRIFDLMLRYPFEQYGKEELDFIINKSLFQNYPESVY